jgi:hypothetical protein
MGVQGVGQKSGQYLRNESGTFMVQNLKKILLEGVFGMYLESFQTTSCLWCRLPLRVP